MRRLIVIGDIHGCVDELSDLLDKVAPSADDKVLSIGDILHKGPDPFACLDLVMSLSNEYILGNHEEKQLRWERHEDRREETGKKNPMRHVEDYERLSPEHRKWLGESARLFIQMVHPEYGELFFTHGGIEGRMHSLPATNIPWRVKRREKRYVFNLIRTRYLDSGGKMIPLGDQSRTDSYWAAEYDGRFGYAVFGHHAQPLQDEPVIFPNGVSIDLGCVYGGRLAALAIPDSGSPKTYTVKARKKYQTHMDQERKNV